jgi:hypothetical protein
MNARHTRRHVGVDGRATGEREGSLGHHHVAVSGEVIARIKADVVVRWQERVRRHCAPKS